MENNGGERGGAKRTDIAAIAPVFYYGGTINLEIRNEGQ
jgi:hypothetical protein